MKEVSVGYDRELGELIMKGPTWENEDMTSYWLSVIIGFSAFFGLLMVGLFLFFKQL